jgi:hypothetical protein
VFIKVEKKVYKGWCSWCGERFKATVQNKAFCSKKCTWAWMEKRASRVPVPGLDAVETEEAA